MSQAKIQSPTDCVGVICLRGSEVLLIQRAKPPRQGEWSIPGGRIEPGETEQDAALRELFEETRVKADILGKVALIDANFEGYHYTLHDYAARWISGEPHADDDAMAAQFVSVDDLDRFRMWPKTTEVILQTWQEWGLST